MVSCNFVLYATMPPANLTPIPVVDRLVFKHAAQLKSADVVNCNGSNTGRLALDGMTPWVDALCKGSSCSGRHSNGFALQ